MCPHSPQNVASEVLRCGKETAAQFAAGDSALRLSKGVQTWVLLAGVRTRVESADARAQPRNTVLQLMTRAGRRCGLT